MAENIQEIPAIVQHRHGKKSDLPQLFEGEGGYTDDTLEWLMNIGGKIVNMNGSLWHMGTAITGTSSTTNAYSFSACPLVKVGDCYLNTAYGYVYQCTTAGEGTAAKWTYKGSIKGATGSYAAVDSALSSTSTNPVQNKVIKDALDNKLDASFNSNGYADLNEITLTLSDMIGEHLAPPTTITIGSVDSNHQWFADYRCDGSNDTTMFQNAIDALPFGGKIVVLEGTYTISSALTCNKNVIIEGMGNGTVINCTNHAFLSNTTAGYRIVIRDMAFNLTGTMTAAAPFISAKSDLDLICCSVTATTTVSESRTDYIKTYANANIAFTAFDVSVKSTYSSLTSPFEACCAIFGFTDGYNNAVSFCDITLTNNTATNYSFNLYASRGYDTISNCCAMLIGASSSNYAILTEGSNAVTGCYIDVTNSYGDINNFKDGSSTTNGVFSGNKVYYASGAYLMFNRVSDNYFNGSGTLRFSGSAPIVTSNRFVNSVSNSISGTSYIIFKDNTLKYSCTVTSSSTAKVSDNIVYSSLT